MPTPEPAHHLIADSGDVKTICGLDSRKPEGWPFLVAEHVHAHEEGHRRYGRPFLLCPTCEEGRARA